MYDVYVKLTLEEDYGDFDEGTTLRIPGDEIWTPTEITQGRKNFADFIEFSNYKDETVYVLDSYMGELVKNIRKTEGYID